MSVPKAAPASPTKRLRVAVDTGGTFTDICVWREAGGRVAVAKVPSTPDNPARAVVEGLMGFLDELGAAPEAIAFFIHGTTVATNALLEGKGAPVALITTAGFEDVILIGRQNRPKLYDHWARRPPPLVPRSQCHGVRERILHTGAVQRPLDAARARQVVQQIKAAGIASIAVSLLHAYANPVHEQQIKQIILASHPDAFVTLSSEVLPEFREFERTSTICINAYVMPRVNAYIGDLQAQLQELGVGSDLYIMQSNGGVITAATARSMSARTVLSGPAGGALTGALLAAAGEQPNVITVDVGGTSSDICLIEGARPRITTESDIQGYPIKLPMIDINTIGAGGGSIAWIDPGGALQVGPVSAGAAPGPVCYGHGGNEPTVTDANVLLGRINPRFLLGGAMPVNLDAARRAVQEKIAQPLGLDLLAAAEGIVRVVNANMIRGIRRVSVERGYDPREFVLVPFGGAGPLHGADLARALNMSRIVIPAHPGIGSAFGMLSADVRHDYVKTHITRADRADCRQVGAFFKDLEHRARTQLAREGFGPGRQVLQRQADLRYLRQAYEITVPCASDDVDAPALAQLIDDFHRHHTRAYGYARPAEPVELVNLRLVALGKLPGLELAARKPSGVRVEPVSRRPVYFDGRPQDTPVYNRERLAPGQRLTGPAVVEQLDATVLVPPGFSARSDPYGNLVMDLQEGAL